MRQAYGGGVEMAITRNRGKLKLLLLFLILVGAFLVTRQGANLTQGRDEIIATFDNGLGGVDTMVRNGKALTLKISSKIKVLNFLPAIFMPIIIVPILTMF